MKIRKDFVAIGAAVTVLIVLLAVVGIKGGDTKVEFTQLEEAKIPQTMVTDVIPEYRGMERALGCIVDKKVYVLVTRGEKPTSGFEVSIEKIELQSKDEKTNLIVYANFADPPESGTVAQIISYPLVVAKTDLSGLPDTIELRIEYIE